MTTATPTVPLVRKAGQAIDQGGAQIIDASLTQMAEDAIFKQVAARMTATAQVIESTATAQKRAEDSQATQRASAATQQAWQVTVQAGQARDTATAQAQATGTAVAWAQGTAQAERNATATAAKATAEAPAVAANNTAIAAKAEKEVIALRQAQNTEWADAWAPYLFFIVALGVLVFLLYRKSQVGVIADDRGRIRAVVMGKSVLNLDLMLRPVMEFNDGRASAPTLGVSDEMQRLTVHESKIVDAISMLPPPMNRQGMQLLGGMTSQQPAVNIQIAPSQSVQGWLDDVQAQISERGG